MRRLALAGMLAAQLWAGTARAESLSERAFIYQGGRLGWADRGDLMAAWDPSDRAAINRPGMKIMFWGRAEGCDSQAGNGPVTDRGGWSQQHALELTGIALAAEGAGRRWTPSADTDQCASLGRDQVGDSYVILNEDSQAGGIGLFTGTGPDPQGHRSFFRQYDRTGKLGKGFNANIEGTFVHFRFDWKNGVAVRPWAGGPGGADQRKMLIRTVQSVAAVSVEADASAAGPIQAKQQIIAALMNRACFLRGEAKEGGVCQLQYLFNTAIYRAGVTDWETARWFRNGGLLVDPGQRGMPVVHGPILAAGRSVLDSGSGLPLFTSQGEASQHTTFQGKEFRIEVSFAQLRDALKVIAGRKLGISPDRVADVDIVSIYGASWSDPNEWLLLSLAFAQEVHNPQDSARVFIGGSLTDLEVGASAQ